MFDPARARRQKPGSLFFTRGMSRHQTSAIGQPRRISSWALFVSCPRLPSFAAVQFYPLFFLFLPGCRQATTPPVMMPEPAVMQCAPTFTDADWYAKGSPAPLFKGMDKISFPVTTSSAEAQRYINQGLLLAYSFNHAEAARSFYQAIRLDSMCAMAYWGYAYVLGPNYNAGMEPDSYPRAYRAIQKALALSRQCSDREKALINAMAKRYARVEPVDRSAMDSAYMVALREAHKDFPADVDIAVMYAESYMDMHPWDLWARDGARKPWTSDILEAIATAIQLDPRHPGGHHLQIHAWEASRTPEQAMASADLLDGGLVGEAGHLVHMPSHIYIHTGDYIKGAMANVRAVQKDSLYVTQCHAAGAYPLTYYPHNYHFLAACATLAGNSALAIDAARKMSEMSNHKGMLSPGMGTFQHYYSIPDYVLVKFGRWDDILALQPVDSSLIGVRAIRHYARGMAFAGQGQLARAAAESAALSAMAAMDTFRTMTIWEINSLAEILRIADHVLKGEILAAKKNFEEAELAFMAAIALEDGLQYNEPPDWFFSVRHHLGAMLLLAGKPEQALAVFAEDLANFPKNGWALNGQVAALTALGQKSEAQALEQQFDKAWSWADVRLRGGRVSL